ncbi:hypothetical protein [Magnetospirillum sulfuroxidans]|uniref:Uncharacterized protein n=1 Tax=Magnetospirillum sulfuroxidans TaxID=611300 RepID=A0ABS5I8S9_9PROT|nr:hypothetical protein [Magnetospirillum sulfuroxidans]MBR9970844.1 hypothetical protein [Magnetospirillum sulfuroxidans]
MDQKETEAAAIVVAQDLIDMIFDKAQKDAIPGNVMVIAMTATLTSVINGAARTPEAYMHGLTMAHRWIGDKITEHAEAAL